MASSLGLGTSFGAVGGRFRLTVFPILTNSHDHVNKTSENQDYSDDLAEAPGVLSRLDVCAIAMDLEPLSVCIPLL